MTDSIERKVKNENRQKMILGILAGSGILAIAVLAPGALKGVGMLQKMLKKPHDVDNTYRALLRLRDKGYVKIEKKGDRTTVSLTEKGNMYLAKSGGVKRKDSQQWDGLWRVVIYDIEEKKRTKRLLLQEALKNTGFYRLQDSVWIYPYPCEELIVLLKTQYQLGREVLYMVVKHLENSKRLQDHFRLAQKT